MFEKRWPVKSTILMAIILALVPTSLASAQFVLDSLPKPGQWARYDQSITYPQKPDEKSEWWLEIRCLPDDSNEGMECVWIEIEQSRSAGRSVIYELLVPQSEFRPGGDPLNHLVEGWKFMTIGTENDVPLERSEGSSEPIRISDGEVKELNKILVISLPDDAEQLMSDDFDVIGKTVRCEGMAFTTRIVEARRDRIQQVETYVSPDTPFGLVSAKQINALEIDRKKYLTSTITTVLVASGDDAVSAIPDVKQARANVAESRRD